VSSTSPDRRATATGSGSVVAERRAGWTRPEASSAAIPLVVEGGNQDGHEPPAIGYADALASFHSPQGCRRMLLQLADADRLHMLQT
jgi:hypothetical protein